MNYKTFKSAVRALSAVNAGVGSALLANRRKRRGVNQTIKPKSKMGVRTRIKKRVNNSRRITRSKKKVADYHATENRFRALTVKSKYPSAMAMAQMSLEPSWFRVQGLTQYDTSYGFYPLANRLATTGIQSLPVHIWDLTCHPNFVSGSYTSPDQGFALWKTSTAAGADANVVALQSQNAAATVSNNTQMLVENSSFTSATEPMPFRKAFHHWSHIKLNLYGVRKRATRYLVQLVQVKQEFSDFISAAGTNVEKRKLYDYLARPFIYNNLQQSDTQTGKDIKILKTYEVIIDPITTDQYNGSNSVPHIQTVNWFVEHNRVRRYDWERAGASATTNDAGFDVESPVSLNTRIDPSYRVYLMIRAMSPEMRSLAAGQFVHLEAADPISEPSYDLVLRNKFSDPQ